MGFFSKKKSNDIVNNAATTNSGMNQLNVSDVLNNGKINLDKSIISLEKKKGISLTKTRARVGVIMDRSGSMQSLYNHGAVQNTLTRLMPLALKFDDNGELDVWLFHDKYARISPMTINNYSNFVEEEITKKKQPYGLTAYAPVLGDVINYYFNENPNSDPVYIVFITDGENSDKRETDAIIRLSSSLNIFIMFIGIGTERFGYLEKLDDLDGRTVDNTAFIKIQDMITCHDEVLYDALLDQFSDWLKA